MSDKAPAAGGGGALRGVLTSPYLLISLTMLFWASNVVLSRGLREEIPLIGLSFWRWSVASLFLLPFSLPHLRRQWPEARRQWWRLAALGGFLVVGGNTVLYLALGHTTAINAAIVNASQPAVTVGLAWLILRDAVNRPQTIGLALSLVGVLAIVARGEAGAFLSLRLNPGDVLMVGAVASWSLYAVLLKRWPMDLHPLVSLQAIMTFGALFVLPLYMYESVAVKAMQPTPATVAMVLYVAVFASIVAVLFWNLGVAAIGPARASIFVNLIPVYTTIAAVLFLGEIVQGFHIAGFALILVGIFLTAKGNK